MKITILAIGKSRTDLHEKAITEYQKRLTRYVKLELIFLPASNKEQESLAIKSHIDRFDYTILLDERGSTWSTPELAASIDKLRNNSVKSVAFIIGGAHGVTHDLRELVDHIWSLSDLVLPHELARLVLIEQIYRSYNIINGGKYHHS
ncbi:23S rRNA (pseudouridine(1915)-N(3))-methyltransferase RlmH [Candidatus Saccharibacteria bacterium]|jgi:23S rRNA (pseudouridine1915-N3)-methyltransferase|nr:23S rRNA (pseudouridine(1915)-N(3))-methyltransferase RlmH [Candidatus Saccharibacteria bacterium]